MDSENVVLTLALLPFFITLFFGIALYAWYVWRPPKTRLEFLFAGLSYVLIAVVFASVIPAIFLEFEATTKNNPSEQLLQIVLTARKALLVISAVGVILFGGLGANHLHEAVASKGKLYNRKQTKKFLRSPKGVVAIVSLVIGLVLIFASFSEWQC